MIKENQKYLNRLQIVLDMSLVIAAMGIASKVSMIAQLVLVGFSFGAGWQYLSDAGADH